MSLQKWLIVRTLAIALVLTAVGIGILLAGTHPAAAEEVPAPSKLAESDPGGAIIQATERISIPYGFLDSLPLTADHASVKVSGQGACTAEESITIAFTVTQSTSGASVTGLWNGDCTGARQTWNNTPTATPGPNFTAGAAEACAFAETQENGSVIDTQDWCDDVFLTAYSVFLPQINTLPPASQSAEPDSFE